MNISLLNVGKTDNKALELLIDDYIKRINRFVKYKHDFIIPPKNIGKLKPEQVKKLEGELILKYCFDTDYIILLDEKGESYTSVEFSNFIQKTMNKGYKSIVFVTGGAYGFSQPVYQRANEMISFSKMTTTHQLIRLFFSEQLYRAFTIIKGHPYHNI